MSTPAHLHTQRLPGEFPVLAVHGLRIASDPGDAACAGALRAWLTTHGVLCIRLDAALTREMFQAVAGMFGNVKDPTAHDRNGAALRYSPMRQVIDAGYVLLEADRASPASPNYGGDAIRPGLFEFFHTDDSFVAMPAAATVLHARTLPPSGGGDTLFMDMRAALALLPPLERQHLVGLRAMHAYNNQDAFPPRASATGAMEALAPVAHPIIRTHPVNAEPALYFDLDRATHIDGLPIERGRALLRHLQDFAERAAPKYAHVWQPHDVLIWDNATVQHKASGDFPVGEPRRFWRHLIEGAPPLPGH